MDGRKEVEALVRQAKAKGWFVEQRGHGYAIGPPDDPQNVVYTGSTPSDSRAMKNTVARLRRRGWEVNGGGGPNYTPEEIREQLEAEVAGLMEERALLFADGEDLQIANAGLTEEAKRAKSDARRLGGEVSARDGIISKMRGQTESWRQESHKWKKRADECACELQRLAREAGVPDEGPSENVAATLEKLKGEQETRREVVFAHKEYSQGINEVLDKVGAPRTAIRKGQEVRLTDVERIKAVSGGADAGALRMKLERVIKFFEDQTTGRKGIVNDIRKTLEKHK